MPGSREVFLEESVAEHQVVEYIDIQYPILNVFVLEYSR
jgi:hypothetical protein